ncbi:MAG: AAA family ATPase [bacterium]|nr:AAA family ATPase [bacterium]
MFDQAPSECTHQEDDNGEIIESPTQLLLKKPILRGDELLQLPFEDNNYIIDKLLWENQIVILLAIEKVGKSILSLQMACALTSGEFFLDEFEVSTPQKVLYIQAEGDRYDTIDRLKRMTSKNGVKWDPENFYHMFPPSIALNTQAGYDDLVEKIKDTLFVPDVIFLDPLYLSMRGDLIDNDACREFCRYARELQAEFNCSIVINHHEHRPKKELNTNRYINEGDNSIMGSFVWKAFPSHIIRMTKCAKTNTRTLMCTTQRNGKIVEKVTMKLLDPVPLKFAAFSDEGHRSDQIYRLMEVENKPLTQDDMVVLSGLSKGVIGKSIAKLVKEDKIIRLNPHKRPIWYVVK